MNDWMNTYEINFIFLSLRSMNATGPVRSKRDTRNFALDPLRSYFQEPQKNEIHLLYLHSVLTSFLFIICRILI